MTSILWRLFVSDLPEWKLRAVDYVGLGFLLLVPEELWRHPLAWYSWCGALVLGVVCLWAGDSVPKLWENVSQLWQKPKDAFIALEKSKPLHNVSFVGFKFVHDEPFRIAALRFQNVPNGKMLGKFERPRLRVIYYEDSTGQEIADMCPLQWWDEQDGIEEIDANGRNAVVASFFEGKWKAMEINEPSEDYDAWNKLHSVILPTGKIRIIASLSGRDGSLSVKTVAGVLNLEADGEAQFYSSQL